MSVLKTNLLSNELHPGAANYASSAKAILKIKSTITGHEEHFIAFLTDFSQNFQSTWNTEEVYGRNDPIATFKSTRRVISLGFDIPAGSYEDAVNNLYRTSNLIQMMYPGYHETKSLIKDSSGNVSTGQLNDNTPTGNTNRTTITGGTVLGKSPLVKISFGNLIRANADDEGLLGWIGTMNWKPNLEVGMFAAEGGNFYPKSISISFDFNVLHQENIGQKVEKESPDWLGSNKLFPFGPKKTKKVE